MKEIESTAFIGMGALGVLFGECFYNKLGDDNFFFLMDEERARRHREDIYTINGKERRFPIKTEGEITSPPDLIIITTKYAGLDEAGMLASRVMGSDTTVISLLNGITSERILAKLIPEENIIDSVAIGMDAMRSGTDLVYQNMGRIQVGIRNESQRDRLDKLLRFFEFVEVPHEECPDIRRAMWVKFMMNTGINQTCMVYECNYREALTKSPIKEDLRDSRHEVIRISEKEGINLTEEDYERSIGVFRTLDPEGFPSMRQDAIAGRKSEVDLFAGTVIELARKHGVSVPVNEKYYRMVLDMESKY